MINANEIQLEKNWKRTLHSEFDKEYFRTLADFLSQRQAEGIAIYPPSDKIFHAFNLTPLEKVKVIILGQDPYHNPGEAMGLCFSVPKTKRIPPSLKNVYKEIHRDLGHPIPSHGDLSSWAEQGVLLLNAMLTVEHKKAGSHRNSGWQSFTDAVIQTLSREKDGLIFLLWGNFAKSKRILIDDTKHLILQAAHPSPLARNAFNDCRHFSKTNHYLKQNGKSEINWQIT